MKLKRLFCLVAALLLVPAVAAADDLSATLAGGGGSGIASITTGSGTVSYVIITNGIGNVTGAEIRQGNSTFINLNPVGGSASVGGAVNTAANLSALNDNTGSFSVRVTGTGGTLNGTLANAGESGGEDPVPEPTPGSIGWTEVELEALEGGGQVTLTATRTLGSDGAVSADWSTAGGSATAGDDFTTASGTLSWADGETGAKMVAIDIIDDGDSEDAETFTVDLSNPTGGATLAATSATVTILDNDTPCVEDANTLCLNEGRFEVTAAFETTLDQVGPANAGGFLTDDTGWFWFFNAQNVEVVIKVLDGCGVNDHYWVFSAGLTNVKVDITVRDTASGAIATYDNPQSTNFQPSFDTAAFMTCP